MLNACLNHCYVNVDMPSVLLELFIALDYDECEGEFYEEVEPCDCKTEGKLQIDHALTYVFILCIILCILMLCMFYKSFTKYYY